jgi:WD40-like Beta Propeller Repeat
MATCNVCSFHGEQRVLRPSLDLKASGSTRAPHVVLTRLLAVATCALACSDGHVVVLGDGVPPRWRFEPPELVSELSVPAKTDNPSLTADMLEIFFTSERNGGPADIFVAARTERELPFGPAERIDALSAAGIETSPAVSADGLTLWFASDRAGGPGELDIWVAMRADRNGAWSPPVNLEALNSSGQDIPRPLGQRARVMPMASDRDMPGYYQIHFATRDDGPAAFAEPIPVPELSFANESTVDGFLSDDGLTLFYVTGPPIGPADMYVVSRPATSDPFEQPTALEELNTRSDERDPWLSPDGRELYFASDRSGHYDIYVARARTEPAAITP